jgi:hypothetical protein
MLDDSVLGVQVHCAKNAVQLPQEPGTLFGCCIAATNEVSWCYGDVTKGRVRVPCLFVMLVYMAAASQMAGFVQVHLLRGCRCCQPEQLCMFSGEHSQ